MFRSWIKKIFTKPSQVNDKYSETVRIFGIIGFTTKAILYSFIGGLTISSALTDIDTNSSPQGVFVFLGSSPNYTGYIILVSVLVGIIIYALWRFIEGFSGQGYDPNFSRKKNFFKYRLSPLASAFVYTAYGIYIVSVLTSPIPAPGSSIRNQDESCFPLCWRNSLLGEIGLGLVAVAFTIATITQLIPAFTGNFKIEMDKTRLQKNKIIKKLFFILGRIGFFARAILFFLVCFLFWSVLFGTFSQFNSKEATVSQAINGLQKYMLGKVVMIVLGLGLIIYGVFALMNTYFKIFPTPPPSENRVEMV